MERQAEEVFAHLDEVGDGSLLEGALREVESGWFQREITDSAYTLERKLNAGRHLVIGVNTAFEGNDEPPPETLRIGPEVEEQQLKRLAKVRADRNPEQVRTSLDAVRAAAAEPTTNVMPALIDAVRVYATEGEIVNALADEFGRYVEVPVL
jgi:methylmalonyl-CoA mutase N-terminal domain/subunit